MDIGKTIKLALGHHRSGDFRQAELLYKKVLKKFPGNFDVLHMLGVLYFQQGKHRVAKTYLEKALRVNQTNAFVYFNLGNVFLQTGEYGHAIEYYEKSLQLNPTFADACFHLANAFREQGRPDDALRLYQRTVNLKPDYADAFYNMGNIFIVLNRLDEGIESYTRALAIKPSHVDALVNKGFALQTRGNIQEALEHYRLALRLDPRSLESYSNLGNLMKDLGQIQEAETCFRRAIEINPLFSVPHSNLLFMMHYDSRFDPETVFNEHLRFAELFEQPIFSTTVLHTQRKNEDRVLKIGYVSPDFRRHSVAYFIGPILSVHQQKQCKVFCYSIVPVRDEVTENFKKYALHWRDISRMTDEESAELIRKDGIDILVDLAGHTANNRILLFARKPAPVQVSWIGYPATTGLSAMDYKIVDSYTDPPGMTEQYYTEKLLRMPECFLCYRPDEESPEVGPLPALSAGHVTFGSCNNFAKVTPQMMELWGKILEGVPGSRLLLKARSLSDQSTREYVRELFQGKGISGDRLKLLGWEPSVKGHLETYHRIDIGLDTFPYHGTTTTCEALWMGVPVVTLAGKTHASRVGVSLLSNAGLPELVAHTGDEYMNIAINLAKETNRLRELRDRLRTMMTDSPLTDAARFTGHLENYFQAIHESHEGSSS